MPAARTSHPSTSHEAAASVQDITETQKYVLRALRRPGTDVALVQRYKALKNAPMASESGIRSRRAELAKAGLVSIVGEDRTPAGRRAYVWKASGDC